MKRMITVLSLVMVWTLVVCGCATTNASRSEYRDPPIQNHEAAFLFTWGNMSNSCQVVAIDTNNIGGWAADELRTGCKRKLRPGVHSILVEYIKYSGSTKESASRGITFEAVTGHTYRACFKRNGDKIQFWIRDEGSRESVAVSTD